jgi:transcriptional regulator GlxA family with amidase domain
MKKLPRIVAFVVAAPLELLDLTGLASVFEYASIRLKNSYLVRILSTERSSEISSIGGLKIAGSSQYFDFSGPIDTLIVLGGERALDQPTAEFVAGYDDDQPIFDELLECAQVRFCWPRGVCSLEGV